MHILFIFAYVTVLYIATAVVVVVAMRLSENKNKRILTVVLIALAIAADLLTFDALLYKKVILKRENIKFSEQPTPYKFSDKRLTNLISDGPFHNFRPSLYKKPAAMSSYTFNDEFLRNSSIVRVYVIIQNNADKYPLYDALNTLSIKNFVKYGFSNMDHWDVQDRRFFSYVLQCVIEGVHIDKTLYKDYLDIGGTTKVLSEDIVRGEAFFTMHSNEWPQRNEVRNTILSLFDFPEEPHIYYKNEDYALLDNDRRPKEQRIREQKFYSYLFNEIPARSYLGYLFERSVMREHSFVLLSDYYQLLNSNKEYSDLRGYSTFMSNKLLAALGVTEPIIRYYPSAAFSDRDSILKAFGSDNTDSDIMYLEGNGSEATGSPSQSNRGFSYDILDYNPNALTLNYNAPDKGYLYFSDSYDTYWNAFVDGKRSVIYKANVAFKAIEIPSGSHKVQFVYDPKYFSISLWVYYITFATCAAYLVIGALMKAGKSGA